MLLLPSVNEDVDALIESIKREVPRSKRVFCSRRAVEARLTIESIVERILLFEVVEVELVDVDDDVDDPFDMHSEFKTPHCCQDPPAPRGRAARSENPAH